MITANQLIELLQDAVKRDPGKGNLPLRTVNYNTKSWNDSYAEILKIDPQLMIVYTGSEVHPAW